MAICQSIRGELVFIESLGYTTYKWGKQLVSGGGGAILCKGHFPLGGEGGIPPPTTSLPTATSR